MEKSPTLTIDIELFPKQRDLLQSTYNYRQTLFGGARGGGKSGGIRRVQLLRRLQHPRSKGAIFRKTYPELEKNHIRKIFQEFPGLRQFYKEGNRTITLPNRSTLEFCYAEKLADIDNKLQGNEWDDLSIDEVGNWPRDEYIRLHHCNRPTGADINVSAYHSANPGGVGHKHLKDRFITKLIDKSEQYHFIPSLVDDNPILMRDPLYLEQLEQEPSKVMREAFRHGNWDIMAGQYFNELSRDVHFIEPFEIPEHWNRFGAYDYGYNHPAAWMWFAVDEDGVVYLYRELIQAGLALDEQAERVLAFSDSLNLIFWSGADCWTTKKAGSPTIAEDLVKMGVRLKPAHIDRIQGASQLRMYLRQNDQKEPRFKIFNTCPITFDCLSRMVHNPSNVEDVLKVDSVEGDPWTGDDAYDCCRYGLMSRPRVSVKLKRRPKDAYRQQEIDRRAVTGWTV